LPGEDFSINRADADIGEKIASFSNGGSTGGVVSIEGIVESEFHEA
jgi:hypothetical protein